MMYIVALEQFTYCERKTQNTFSYRWDGLSAERGLSLLSYAFILGYIYLFRVCSFNVKDILEYETNIFLPTVSLLLCCKSACQNYGSSLSVLQTWFISSALYLFSAMSVFVWVSVCGLWIYYIQNKTPTFTHGNTNTMLHSLRFLCCFLPDKSPTLPLPHMLYFSLRPILSLRWTSEHVWKIQTQ